MTTPVPAPAGSSSPSASSTLNPQTLFQAHRSLSSALGFRVQRVGGHPLSSLVVLGQDFLLIEDRLESGPWLLAPLFWGVEYKLPSEEYPVNDVCSFLWRLISGNLILLQCLGCRFGLVQGTITSHPKPSEEKDAWRLNLKG